MLCSRYREAHLGKERFLHVCCFSGKRHPLFFPKGPLVYLWPLPAHKWIQGPLNKSYGLLLSHFSLSFSVVTFIFFLFLPGPLCILQSFLSLSSLEEIRKRHIIVILLSSSFSGFVLDFSTFCVFSGEREHSWLI